MNILKLIEAILGLTEQELPVVEGVIQAAKSHTKTTGQPALPPTTGTVAPSATN